MFPVPMEERMGMPRRIPKKYEAEHRDAFFQQHYDYIVDAIDLVSCKLDLVVVHQGEVPHPGAGQGLGAPAADPAQAKDGCVGMAQTLHGGGAKEHFCAKESRLRQVV